MKPNLLNFTNYVLLSVNKRGTYHLKTGESNPDTGFMVSIVEEKLPGVDESMIREFWREYSDLLAGDRVWLGIWFDGQSWIFAAGELIADRTEAIFKGIMRSAGGVWDNEKNELIEIPTAQTGGKPAQNEAYARMKSQQL